MSKEFRTILITAIVAILTVFGIVYATEIISEKNNEIILANTLNHNTNKETESKTNNQNMEVILSLEDKITDNSIWCRNI